MFDIRFSCCNCGSGVAAKKVFEAIIEMFLKAETTL